MSRYPQRVRINKKERKRPLGYICYGQARPLFVVGHYETDCGGCDTITSVQEVYDIVQEAHDQGFDVLYEGLLISAEFRRTLAMSQDPALEHTTIGIDITLEECLASVNARRRANYERRVAATNAYNAAREAKAVAAGRRAPKPRPLPTPRGDVSERNTKSKWTATRTIMRKLQEAEVRAEWHTRESAINRILEILGHENS